MLKLEKYLGELLAGQDLNPQDKGAIEGHLQLVKTWNEIKLASLPTAKELVATERKAWGTKEIPNPPTALFEVLAKAKEQGILIFDAHYLPRAEFKKSSKWPGKGIKPGDFYWEIIKDGGLAEDSAELPGAWVLVDKTPKPNYDGGKQLYKNDPLAPILARGRRERKIAVPSILKHVPETSRFGVSADEVEQYVAPEVARLLGVDGSAGAIVRTPREIEFNVLGNNFYPEWGQTDTREWFKDQFGVGRRPCGGRSDDGGLADVDWHSSVHQSDRLAFRFLVVFPRNP